jgi:hypothetical protein
MQRDLDIRRLRYFVAVADGLTPHVRPPVLRQCVRRDGRAARRPGPTGSPIRQRDDRSDVATSGMTIDTSAGNPDAAEWTELAATYLAPWGARPVRPHRHVVGSDETARHLTALGMPILSQTTIAPVPGAVLARLTDPVPTYRPSGRLTAPSAPKMPTKRVGSRGPARSRAVRVCAVRVPLAPPVCWRPARRRRVWRCRRHRSGVVR